MRFAVVIRFPAILTVTLLLLMTATSAAETRPHHQFLVRVDSAHLFIHAQRAPLVDLLTEIAKHSGIEVFYQGDADRLTTIELSSASLENGLKRLLRGINHAITYGADGENQVVVKQLYVHGEAGAGPMKPLRPIQRVPSAPAVVHRATSPHLAEGIVIHPATPVDANPLVSMQAIDPLMRINGLQAPYLPSNFHGEIHDLGGLR